MKSHQRGDERVPTVVVGVDGSEGSTEALGWAFAEARLRNAPLLAIHAGSFGSVGVVAGGYGYFGMAIPLTDATVTELRAAAQKSVDEAVDAVAVDFPGVSVDRQVVDGGAAEVLIAAAATGDLLVVGARGHGGFAELLLGSVSLQCVHHAPCPVVVVHAPTGTSDHGDSDLSAAATSKTQPVLATAQ